MNTERRKQIAVIGDAKIDPDSEKYGIARDIGCLLVDNGFRVITGGLGGVMEAACRGAMESVKYQQGDTIGVLPGNDPDVANKYVDIVIPTGMDINRNSIVVHADAVIAVGGGAGTLCEMAFAWMLKRLLVAVDTEGWSGQLAGKKIDHRLRQPGISDDCVYKAKCASDTVEIVIRKLSQYQSSHKSIR